MTDLFMWSAASHYGRLPLGWHVPPSVVFPGTFIKCLMAKNRGQATLSSRLAVLANAPADGKKMEGVLESNKSLFVSLARTLPTHLLLGWGNLLQHFCLFACFDFMWRIDQTCMMMKEKVFLCCCRKVDVLKIQGFSLRQKLVYLFEMWNGNRFT